MLAAVFADVNRHMLSHANPLKLETPGQRANAQLSPTELLSMKIGVLALQGDFDAHRRRLEELGADVVLVKKPEQFDEIDGLVIPGGESGTFLNLLGETGFEKLKQFVRVRPTFGTCAGAILLAKEVENPPQRGLGALNIRVRRNAYGRQVDSSIREGQFLSVRNRSAANESPLEMVFIRAPKIIDVGEGVEVIAREGNDPVAVRQGKTMAATFHPELSPDTRVHRAFLDLVQNGEDKDSAAG
jgi:pyridoxal 5'-phosphate synthase pdxT subunit